MGNERWILASIESNYDRVHLGRDGNTNNDGKLIFGFLSSDCKHIGEVNVCSLIRTENRELREFCEAVKIILGALIGPKFINIGNTLPLSAHVDTSSLFSFFIFMAIFGE